MLDKVYAGFAELFIKDVIAKKANRDVKYKGEPWTTCPLGRLKEKLEEEFKEFKEASNFNVVEGKHGMMSELVDITMNCVFIWARLKRSV